ncbi:MAG: flagellar type III secretion system pore protein FliP [Bdellovibrionaceae bacterium]|nr:flagellar type III secretion system pore protein FliP [Pseudobdellovibrionaceae bacterium]MDW8190850.1 flagellar type III secretion system pore protein FliP [Pseudobdellovibrionaceae bacterium]
MFGKFTDRSPLLKIFFNIRPKRVLSYIVFLAIFCGVSPLLAQIALPNVNVGFKTVNDPNELVASIKIILVLTVLTLAPAILIMMTSFTRIIVVFGFLRQAIGVQQMPPNQLLVGLALFLTVFIMKPTFEQIHEGAIAPFLKGQINQEKALEHALSPLRKFMFAQTRSEDLTLFVKLSQRGSEKVVLPQNLSEVSTFVLVPAFIISELKTAFQIGFLLFLPFLIIDIVVSSVLMSMGMMMLPPIIISLPLKIMLFVLVDGWGLVVGSMVKSFGV